MTLKSLTYLEIMLLFCVSLLFRAPVLFSQEEKKEDEDDTLKLVSILRGPDSDYNLNIALLTASAEGHIRQIKWLLKNGADINTSTYNKITSLHFAAANGQKEALRVLLEHKPNLNTLSVYSEAPLHIAVKQNNEEIAEMLIRAGADVNIRDRFGATPLHYASIYGYFSIADMLLYYDAVIWHSDYEGTTPLMSAVWAGHANIADLLLQKGADPSEKDRNGFTPFMIAAQNGDTLIMDLLIKRYVNIYETNRFGYNALNLAIMGNHKAATEYLLRKGDKWTSTEISADAFNPYSVAIAYGRNDLSEILDKHNMPRTVHQGFDQVNISSSAKFNFNDFYSGISVSFKAPLNNTGITAGLDFKPVYTRVLVRESDYDFFQYMDKSYLFYFGVFKDFSLTDNPLRGNWSLTLSLASGYYFGNKLKGTLINPGNKFKIMPSAGLKWTRNHLILKTEIEYFKTPFYRIGPLWIKAGAGYTFYFRNIRSQGKYIKWY